jgi:hypothetical protein
MTNNWLDIIKEKFYFQEKKVPEQIWLNVQKNLPKKKQRRGFFIPIFYLSIFFIAGYSVSRYMQKENSLVFDHNLYDRKNFELNERAYQSNLIPIKNQVKEEDQSIIFDELSNVSKIELKNKKLILASKSDSGHTTLKQNYNTGIPKFKNKDLFDERITGKNTNTQPGEELTKLEFLPPRASELVIQSEYDIRKNTHTECFNFKRKNARKLSLEIYAGPGYNPYKLITKSEHSEGFLQKRLDSEKSMISGIAGIRAVFSFSQFAIRAGVEYQHIYEQFKYRNSNDYKVVQVYKDSQLIRIDTLFGSRYLRINNYHRMIHIPISFAYEFRRENIWYSVQPGIGINIWSNHRGIIYDSFLRPTSVQTASTTGQDVFKTRVGAFAFLNFQVSKSISPDIKIFMEPGIIYFMNTFTNRDFSLDQRYVSYHIKLGINYNIR